MCENNALLCNDLGREGILLYVFIFHQNIKDKNNFMISKE